MTKLPGKPAAPFTPTVDDDGNPTTCFCCGMRAVGIGVGAGKDPGYLCKRCIVAIDDYKKIRRLDDFELSALDAGVDAVGEFIESKGNLTDLAHYDELDQRLLVKAAWEGCARGLREALKSAPF